jgi:hypothetical protein
MWRYPRNWVPLSFYIGKHAKFILRILVGDKTETTKEPRLRGASQVKMVLLYRVVTGEKVTGVDHHTPPPPGGMYQGAGHRYSILGFSPTGIFFFKLPRVEKIKN